MLNLFSIISLDLSVFYVPEDKFATLQACPRPSSQPEDEGPGYPAEDPENWTYVGNIPDRTNMFAARPLTRRQMNILLKSYSDSSKK
jgi:hypothetical protein